MVTRSDVIREARTWIGTPFRHQGRIKGEASDCVGLIVETAKTLGISSFDYRNYGVIPQRAVMERLLDEHLDRVAPGREQPGDLPWMRDPRAGGAPRHMAILTEDGGMIHADSDIGRVVEHRFTDDYRKQTVRFYRFRGIQ